jgi:plasmid stabilization system protein ParE
MASKPVRFHPDAEQEYLASLAWYKERSEDAALDFENQFHKAVSAIAEAPDRWPVYLTNFRRYVVRQFPFSIVYRSLDNEVFVLAVAHAHRRPGYWRKSSDSVTLRSGIGGDQRLSQPLSRGLRGWLVS